MRSKIVNANKRRPAGILKRAVFCGSRLELYLTGIYGDTGVANRMASLVRDMHRDQPLGEVKESLRVDGGFSADEVKEIARLLTEVGR